MNKSIIGLHAEADRLRRFSLGRAGGTWRRMYDYSEWRLVTVAVDEEERELSVVLDSPLDTRHETIVVKLRDFHDTFKSID